MFSNTVLLATMVLAALSGLVSAGPGDTVALYCGATREDAVGCGGQRCMPENNYACPAGETCFKVIDCERWVDPIDGQ